MGGQSSNNKLNSITSVQENVKIIIITKTIGFIQLLLIRIVIFIFQSYNLELTKLILPLSCRPCRYAIGDVIFMKRNKTAVIHKIFDFEQIFIFRKSATMNFSNELTDANYSPQLGFCIPSQQRDVELLLGTFTRDYSKHFQLWRLLQLRLSFSVAEFSKWETFNFRRSVSLDNSI